MKVREKPSWYGIINCSYRPEAILQLMDTKVKWKEFCWFVTLVKSGFQMEGCKQLASPYNLLHFFHFYVQFTLAGILYSPRMEFNLLQLKESRATAVMIAKLFTGNGKHGSSSIKQTAQTAMPLSMVTVSTIREALNAKDSHLCTQNERLKNVWMEDRELTC